MSGCSWWLREDTQGFVTGPAGKAKASIQASIPGYQCLCPCLEQNVQSIDFDKAGDCGPREQVHTASHGPGVRHLREHHIPVQKRNTRVPHGSNRIVNRKWECLRGRMKQRLWSQGVNSLFSVPRLRSCGEFTLGNSLFLWSGLKWNHPGPGPPSQRAKPRMRVLHVFFPWTLPASFVCRVGDEVVRSHLLLDKFSCVSAWQTCDTLEMVTEGLLSLIPYAHQTHTHMYIDGTGLNAWADSVSELVTIFYHTSNGN